MIDVNELVQNVRDGVGLWCPAVDDDMELAKMVECAVNTGVGVVAVPPTIIGRMWPWLERVGTDMIARFYIAPARTIQESAISELVKNVKAAFKSGASGAQVFVPVSLLADFAREMRVVRNDLFFNRDLIIGLDICHIEWNDWPMVFDALIELRADSVLFVQTIDLGQKSDFAGRVYAMLNSWNPEFTGGVCWMLNDNFYRFEQALRLTESVRPELLPMTRILVNFGDK